MFLPERVSVSPSVSQAILAINEAVDGGDPAQTLGALRNPSAGLYGVTPECAPTYQDDLVKIKGAKKEEGKEVGRPSRAQAGAGGAQAERARCVSLLLRGQRQRVGEALGEGRTQLLLQPEHRTGHLGPARELHPQQHPAPQGGHPGGPLVGDVGLWAKTAHFRFLTKFYQFSFFPIVKFALLV